MALDGINYYGDLSRLGGSGSSFALDPFARPLPAVDPATLPAAVAATLGMGQGASAYDIPPLQNFSSMPDASGSWWDSPFLKSMIGTKEAPGWGGMAVGGASALTNAILGYGQLHLAKDALATNKKQFQMNYDAQKTTTNTALEDRQRARTASNPGAYQSVGDYMSQHRIA